MPANQVPRTVPFDDFQTAIKPLLNLVGVTVNEVLCDLRISSGTVGTRIDFQLVAHDPADDGEWPEGMTLPSAPQEHAELVWPCSVDVI